MDTTNFTCERFLKLGGGRLDNGVTDSVFIGEHVECIADEFPLDPKGNKRKPCGSSDALACYEHEEEDGSVTYDAFCWSCRQKFYKKEVHSSSIAALLGIESGVVKERKVFENKASKKEKITREERDELWSRTGWKANGYRSLTDEVLQFYGHRTELDKDGKVLAQYYPETQEGSLFGYKSKHFPKNFGYGNVGCTGSKSDLSGQHKFPEGGKYCLLVGGEDDKVAAQVMLLSYQRQKNQDGYNPYSVVAPTTGEPTAYKQCSAQYEWFDKHDIIVIGMDNDEAGEEALKDIIRVLPKEKLRIARWSRKDPNNMLQEGMQKQFLSDFFGAEPFMDLGVYDATDTMTNDVIEVLTTPRIGLPPFAARLQEMTKGAGLYTKSIYSFVGDTSVGKSTHIDAWIYYWMFNLTHHKVGIVSLEATKGEWVTGMLSTYLGKNLWWMPQEEVEEYLSKPEIKELLHNFYYNEYGEARFAIVDDREGTVDSLQKCIERLERQFGCTIIVNDVLTDILRVVDNETQARHFNWQSNFVKGGSTIFNVLHTRKPPSDRKGKPTFPDEFDTYGSSIFVQKAAGNFIIARNKEAPAGDMIEQNTTYLRVPKLRKGMTGSGGSWYYDGETRQVYDRDSYFKDNPDKLPNGYDLTVSSFDKSYWEEGGRGYDGSSEMSYGGKRNNNVKPMPSINPKDQNDGDYDF